MTAVVVFKENSQKQTYSLIFVNLAETNLVTLVAAETAIIKEPRKEQISQVQF